MPSQFTQTVALLQKLPSTASKLKLKTGKKLFKNQKNKLSLQNEYFSLLSNAFFPLVNNAQPVDLYTSKISNT